MRNIIFFSMILNEGESELGKNPSPRWYLGLGFHLGLGFFPSSLSPSFNIIVVVVVVVSSLT